MATQLEIESLYDWVDWFHIARAGDYADFSCAFFNGNFNQSLAAAQKAKHQWVLQGLDFHAGDSILDIGCGWGAMLNAVGQHGGHAVGLTLSRAQARYCVAKGFDVLLRDWKRTLPRTLGPFDGVIAIGSFEHFCSIEECLAGKQDCIYRQFFHFCAEALPAGGKLFVQTMTWGKTVPDPKKISLKAPEGSPEKILARLSQFYPGSWLPNGRDQIIEAASGCFNFLSSNNGRLDYIETLNRWGAATTNLFKSNQLSRLLCHGVRLAWRYCWNRQFRVQIESVRRNDQQACFMQEIMSHERMFFIKK